MKQLLIADKHGTGYTGHLPEGWHEVPVSTFITYESEIKDLNKGQRMVQLAHLLSGIPTQVLSEDVSLAAKIQAECPFFFQSMPEALPAYIIQLGNRTWYYRGQLERITAGQFEALLEFIKQAKEKPLASLHYLLGVLYTEQGVPQTAETVTANAALFLSLPMSQAYGAVGFFLSSTADVAMRIQKYSEMEAKVLTAVREIEHQLLRSSSSRSGVLQRKFSNWLLWRLRKLMPSVSAGS